VQEPELKQPLLRITARDGGQFVFAILNNDGAAILRNGDIIYTAEAGGLDDAVERFMKLLDEV
jgi:hypothetical protein